MTPHSPGPGEVHIRLINLAVTEDKLTRLEQLLTPDERERAERLIDRKVRNRFIAGRGLLRETLSEYLNHPPASLLLDTSEHGKPFLSAENHNHELSFNLSHSGDLAIMAITKHCQLGIDLERLRDDLPFRAMAQQFFSRREQTDLFSLPVELQPAAFYRCWTRKEAYLKGCGSGFSSPSNHCDVSLLPGQPPALLSHRTDPGHPSKWSLADLDVPEGFCAALAIQAIFRTPLEYGRQQGVIMPQVDIAGAVQGVVTTPVAA